MEKFGSLIKGYLGVLAGIIVVMVCCSMASATPASVFTGWQEFADDRDDSPSGGQAYDHEYFFYNYDESTKKLSIGVQSGFDMVNGAVNNLYLGDLGLSFDNDTQFVDDADTGYEYAYDFGLLTKDYHRDSGSFAGENVDADTDGLHGGGDGEDSAGLYEVATWNNHTRRTFHTHRTPDTSDDDRVAPFAMDGGVNVAAALSNISGDEGDSYYRIAEFSVASLLNDDGSLRVDAHIAMSCGNDVMNGGFNIPGSPPGAPIPEPSTVALLGVGLAGLAGGAARRKLKKKKEDK